MYPNHSFHLERSKQELNEQHPRSYRVSEGRLTEAETGRVYDLLSDPELATYDSKIKVSGGTLTVYPGTRLFSAEIPRDRYRTQTLATEISNRDKPPADLKALVDFFDALVARDPAITPDAKPDNCRRPTAKPLDK